MARLVRQSRYRGWGNLKSGTEARENAIALAKTDVEAATKNARAIEDPWFRSQAMAWIARFSAEKDFHQALDEAASASWAADDPYKIVASSAWRLRAMVERGHLGDVQSELPKLLECASGIANPVSRLDALFLVFQSVFDVEAFRHLVLRALVDACQAAVSWKAGDRLSEAAVMLAFANDKVGVDEVIQSMPDGKRKRQAMQRIADRLRREPRRFFW